MNKRKISGIATLVTALLAGGALAALPSDAAVSNAYKRPATNDEYALMVLANMERAARGTRPYVWNDSLAEMARYHSHDMAENNCFQHEDCIGGRTAGERFDTWYPDWQGRGENVGQNGGPRSLHDNWMGSEGHRSNILHTQFFEFGAGIAWQQTNFGDWSRATQDVGVRTSVTIPKIPAGAVLPRLDSASVPRELLVNVYGIGTAFRSVTAVVDGQPITLTRYKGSAANGTYRTMHTFGGAARCATLHFEAVAGGVTHRWPASGSILVGVNRFDCAERSGATAPPTTIPPPTTIAPPTTTPPTTTAPPTTTPAPGAPTVVIDAPQPGSISGLVEIRAHATDDGTVKKMQIRIDGKNPNTKKGAVISRKWAAGQKSVKPGPHTITVTAWDDAGLSSTATVVVHK